jgi:uncharacterized membrane protein AbrB (regulator of aidB expression)
MSTPGPSVLTAGFWTGLADRAIKTFFQVLAVMMVGYAAKSHDLNVFAVNWWSVLGYSLGAALLSVLTSFGSAPIGTPGTTSFLPGGI